MIHNIDRKTVNGFGYEWTRFNYKDFPDNQLEKHFNVYFGIFPWDVLPEDADGFDFGCGSGRWAKFVGPKIGGTLHCIDASAEALNTARENLKNVKKCKFYQSARDELPLPDNSMAFGYSLGVLHHMPDTLGGLKQCVRKLKPNAPFLLYVYYAIDNRPCWYRLVWKGSELVRLLISRLPIKIAYLTSQFIAFTIYLPLARLAKAAELLGLSVHNWPLSAYRDRAIYFMRTDAFDRFNTSLEKRFTRSEVRNMMEMAGLENIRFSHKAFWIAVGFKKPDN